MKLSKHQLKRIIKEERQKLLREQSTADIMNSLLSLLRQAESVASTIGPGDEESTGSEGRDLSAALQDVWVAFGGYPDEIFK